MINKEWLVEHYVNKGKSAKECGGLIGKDGMFISRALKKHGVPSRSLKDAYYLSIAEKRRDTRISRETAAKISQAKKGVKRSRESIEKQKSTIKNRKSNCGRKPSHGKGYYLDIGGKVQYFRSTWECKYAVYLAKGKKKWSYEPYRFLFQDKTLYTPDFLVGRDFIEIKGWLQQRHIDKLGKLRAEFGINVRLLRKKDIEALGVEWKDVEVFIVATSGNLMISCLYCDRQFLRNRKDSKFCSIKCSSESWREKHSVSMFCQYCNVAYRKSVSLAKGSKYCCRRCKDLDGRKNDSSSG